MKKKIVSFLTAIVLSFVLISCDFSSSEQDLYEYGIEVIAIMDEMIESEEYISLYTSNDFKEIIEEVKANDYDSPIAVYSITMPEIEELLDIYGDDGVKAYENLTDELKEQVENRFSFSAIVSMINAKESSNKMAFSSICTATKKVENLKVDDTVVYLYVFEKGTPIVISFGDTGYVNGQFLFAEDLESTSDVGDVLEEYECSVDKIRD